MAINYKSYQHIVPQSFEDRERLSKYLIGKSPYLETGKSVKKAIKKQEVYLNGIIGYSGDWITKNDIVEYRRTKINAHPIDVTIEVSYEDDHLMVINKPPGILSSGNASKTLQLALQSYPINKIEGALYFPYLVHRLDRQTSGLIIAAKTIQSRRILGEMVGNRDIRKEYTLIAQGYLDRAISVIDSPIDDKEAKTEILNTVHLQTKDPASLIKVRLHTGRTHQVRKHLFALGHPIVGDDIYNKDGLSFGRGLFLMADYISFQHPITEENIEIRLATHKKFMKYS